MNYSRFAVPTHTRRHKPAATTIIPRDAAPASLAVSVSRLVFAPIRATLCEKRRVYRSAHKYARRRSRAVPEEGLRADEWIDSYRNMRATRKKRGQVFRVGWQAKRRRPSFASPI